MSKPSQQSWMLFASEDVLDESVASNVVGSKAYCVVKHTGSYGGRHVCCEFLVYRLLKLIDEDIPTGEVFKP